MVLKIKDILATRKKLEGMKLSKAKVHKGTFEDTPDTEEGKEYKKESNKPDGLLLSFQPPTPFHFYKKYLII